MGVGYRGNGRLGDMLELVESVTDSHAEAEVRLELGREWLEQGFTRSACRGRDAVLGSVNPDDSQRANELTSQLQVQETG